MLKFLAPKVDIETVSTINRYGQVPFFYQATTLGPEDLFIAIGDFLIYGKEGKIR